jgi:glycosyltransferase involved in cell wall biosynthesis
MEKEEKRVLLISSNFSPEESGIAVYSSDLAYKVLSPEFNVTVLTGLPHYPWWTIPECFAHLTAGRSMVNKLDLIRVNHVVPANSGAVGRARLEYSFWANGSKVLNDLDADDFDLVLAIMPTVASGLLARKFAKVTNIPGIIIFQDVTSLGTLQSGMPGAPFLYKIAKFLEILASRWATKLVVVSEQMEKVVSELLENSVPVEVIHNYSTLQTSTLNYLEARNELQIPKGQFLLLHTGNIGHKQDLGNVVEAAKLLVDHSEFKFLIVGHGNQEHAIRLAIGDSKNIELRPFVNSKDYPKLLVAADVLLVNERPSLREMSLPSKLTSYLISGRPVIAAVSEHSATSKFIKDAALVVEPGNPRALADAILQLKGDVELQEDLGQRGKRFAALNLSPESGRAKYLNLVREVLTKARR